MNPIEQIRDEIREQLEKLKLEVTADILKLIAKACEDSAEDVVKSK